LKPYLQDPDLTVYNGEALATLRELPDDCVDCIVTSPPYWGLRDYGTASWEGGDPDCEHVGQVARTAPPGTEKQASNAGSNGVRAGDCACGARRVDQQIGLEASLEEYVEALVEVFREVRRVLRKHGTVWLNIGDSYSGAALGSFNGGGFKDRSARTGGRDLSGVETSGQMDKVAGSGLKPKDLCLIPARVALALQADGWYVRSDVIWDKPNPMPSSVTDRPTTTHEYLFMLTKAPRYYFDQDAVREPYSSENGTNGSESVERLTLGDLPPEAPRGVDGRRKTQVAGGEGSLQHRDGERWPERPQTVRARELFEASGLTDAHLAAIRACGTTDAGKSQVTQSGYGRNDPEVKRLADEAKGALGGYYREFLTPTNGRNVRTVWRFPTQPFPGAHFAVFPAELPRRCISASTSEVGYCPICRAPWERDVERTKYEPEIVAEGERQVDASRSDKTRKLSGAAYRRSVIVLGESWRPTCSCGGPDLTPIRTPTGKRAGEDPSMLTGRAGFDRPRGEDDGVRTITRYEQEAYAAQLKASPARERMEDEAGRDAFAHYLRTDRAGARPIPERLLRRWIARRWLERVVIPESEPPEPVPGVVLDPFGGSGTVGLVARKLGRHAILIELSTDFCGIIAERTQQLSLEALA
jgi:DNA modification methylase